MNQKRLRPISEFLRDWRDKQILKHYKRGMEISKLAQVFNLPKQNVFYIVKKKKNAEPV